MNNFGVIELASTKTKNAPGWQYVPDVGPSPAAASLQPANRKRARNQGPASASDLSARQDAKIRKDLEALDRDIHKDAAIPIPPRSGGSRAQSKHTPNVRKILQSQKTFANHLDDYLALVALAETNPAAAAALTNTTAPPKPAAAASNSSARNSNSPAPSASGNASGSGATSKRSGALAKRQALAAAKEQKEAARKKAAEETAAAKAMAEAEADENADANEEDVEMTDAPAAGDGTTPQPGSKSGSGSAEPQLQATPQIYPPDGTILPAYRRAPPPTHPGDKDPLLVSYVPPFPTDDQLRALMTAPPLSYLEARATWGEEEGRYPQRVFCEVCGYWGRVRCLKCGARACALDCLQAHKEECFTRYGL